MSWSIRRADVSLRVAKFVPESSHVEQSSTQGRDVESGRTVPLVSGLGAVGPDRPADTAGTITIEPRIWPATARAPFRVVRLR